MQFMQWENGQIFFIKCQIVNSNVVNFTLLPTKIEFARKMIKSNEGMFCMKSLVVLAIKLWFNRDFPSKNCLKRSRGKTYFTSCSNKTVAFLHRLLQNSFSSIFLKLTKSTMIFGFRFSLIKNISILWVAYIFWYLGFSPIKK